jgi:hypothetical protein
MERLTKIKTVVFSFVIIVFFWLLLSLLLGTYRAASDGLNEVGFPFTFYRKFTGKCIACEYKNVFLFGNFILDILLILLLSLVIGYVSKTNPRTNAPLFIHNAL